MPQEQERGGVCASGWVWRGGASGAEGVSVSGWGARKNELASALLPDDEVDVGEGVFEQTLGCGSVDFRFKVGFSGRRKNIGVAVSRCVNHGG